MGSYEWFGVPQVIYQGPGCINAVPEILKKEGWKRVLIVCGPTLLKTGVIGIFEDMLKEAADVLDSDLYILPDSLHLLFIIAVKSIPRKIVLESFSRAMLLEPDAFDFLSDNVYYYDRKKGTLRILSARTKRIS